MGRTFSIDSGRLAAFRARADEARGASRLMQQRVTDARNRLTEAEAELRRIERSRPGSPRGVVRIGPDGRAHGKFESRHEEHVASARRRAESAKFELAELARDAAAGAAKREHDQQLWSRIQRYVEETGR